MNKRLERSQNKLVSGVCAGVAEYLGLDPTIVRLGYVLLTLCTAVFPCVVFYLICIFVIPEGEHRNDGYVR